jgi:hypothetical protein
MSREGDWRVRVLNVTEGGGRSRRMLESDSTYWTRNVFWNDDSAYCLIISYGVWEGLWSCL